MTFAPRPPYSKGAIDRAGRLLISEIAGSTAYNDALQVVNEWRTCHAYPLNTFNSTLRRKVGRYKGTLVAQRLKRLPTIVDKLKRYPDMNLSRMQDIGGIRAILDNVEGVRRVYGEYKDQGRFTHKLQREDDYILSPKSDGYRGIHLVFEYDNRLSGNELAKSYKGLHIEMQIRTQLQHTWATAVETTGTLIGESFKTGAGSKNWKEFFSLVSSAFAIVEGTAVVARHEAMNPNEILLAIKKLEKKLGVIDHIKGLSTAVEFMHRNNSVGYYNIIVLDTLSKELAVYSFNERQLKEATDKYAELEATSKKGIDQVLVRAGDLKSLKAAYPNYFLDIRDFAEKLSVLIEEAKE